MTDAPTEYPTISLRGATVPIRVAKVQLVATPDGGARYELERDPEGQPLVEEIGLSMDVNLLAEYEEHWGSLDAWQEALGTKPFSSMRMTLAIALGRDVVSVGKSLLPTETKNYGAAIAAAFAIANGVDPTQAMQIVEQASRINMNTSVQELLAEAAKSAESPASTGSVSPSDSGSRPGPVPVATTPSSGD